MKRFVFVVFDYALKTIPYRMDQHGASPWLSPALLAVLCAAGAIAAGGTPETKYSVMQRQTIPEPPAVMLSLFMLFTGIL